MIKLKDLLNEASPLRRNITDTFKDLDKKFTKKFPSSQIHKVEAYIMNKYDIYENPLLNNIPSMIADTFYDYKRGKITIKKAITTIINRQRGY